MMRLLRRGCNCALDVIDEFTCRAPSRFQTKYIFINFIFDASWGTFATTPPPPSPLAAVPIIYRLCLQVRSRQQKEKKEGREHAFTRVWRADRRTDGRASFSSVVIVINISVGWSVALGWVAFVAGESEVDEGRVRQHPPKYFAFFLFFSFTGTQRLSLNPPLSSGLSCTPRTHQHLP